MNLNQSLLHLDKKNYDLKFKAIIKNNLVQFLYEPLYFSQYRYDTILKHCNDNVHIFRVRKYIAFTTLENKCIRISLTRAYQRINKFKLNSYASGLVTNSGYRHKYPLTFIKSHSELTHYLGTFENFHTLRPL